MRSPGNRANRHDGEALPDLLVKTQTLYHTPDITMYHLIGDATYDVQALWDFARQRGLIPAVAPMRPVEPPHVRDAALAAGVTLSETHQPICGVTHVQCRAWDNPVQGSWCRCPLLKKSAPPCLKHCDKASKTVTVNSRGSRYADSGVPHGTPEWTTLYHERTGVERSGPLVYGPPTGLRQRTIAGPISGMPD